MIPATGTVTVDLDALTGVGLDGLGPNTPVLTAAQLTTIATAVDTVLASIVDDLAGALEPLIDAAEVDVTAGLTLDGDPLAGVTVDGTIRGAARGGRRHRRHGPRRGPRRAG